MISSLLLLLVLLLFISNIFNTKRTTPTTRTFITSSCVTVSSTLYHVFLLILLLPIILIVILSPTCTDKEQVAAYFPSYNIRTHAFSPSLLSSRSCFYQQQCTLLLFNLQAKRKTTQHFQPDKTSTSKLKRHHKHKKGKSHINFHQIKKSRQNNQYSSHNQRKSNNEIIEKTVVILYHKPKNVIVSHSNSDSVSKQKGKDNSDHHGGKENDRITVYDDIMSMKGFIDIKDNSVADFDTEITEIDNVTLFQKVTKIKSKLHAIGRLDVDTTGLLLLTNDGALVHHVTNPNAKSKLSAADVGLRNHDKTVMNFDIVKTYEALIMGYHTLPSPDIIKNYNRMSSSKNHDTEYKLVRLFQGVDIGSKYGGMTKPVHDLQVISHPTDKSTLVRLSISEGKNRQVRRMFHAIGSGVMKLHRVQVGNIDLSMLHTQQHEHDEHNYNSKGGHNEGNEGKEGNWRLLNEVEIWNGLGWKVRTW